MNKNIKTTQLAQLTLRYVKEKNLYENFLKKTKKNKKNLMSLTQYNTLGSVLSFVKIYAIDATIAAQTNNKERLEIIKEMENDFENFIYENIHKKNKILLLHKFLDDNNIRKQFYDNLKKQKETYNSAMNGYYSRLDRMINDAFDWSLSKEGFDFWVDKNHKLIQYANDLVNNKQT